jgi:hypothetical protein
MDVKQQMTCAYSDVLELFGGARGSYLEFVDDLYHICDAGACGLDRMQQVMLQTFLSQNIFSYADAAAMDSSQLSSACRFSIVIRLILCRDCPPPFGLVAGRRGAIPNA